MCFVPEERLGHGSVPDMSLWENAVLTAQGAHEPRAASASSTCRAAKDFAGKIVADFGVRTPGVDHAARSLSGGNLQKFVIGREMLQAPVGADRGAADLGRRCRCRRHHPQVRCCRWPQTGTAILIVSQDLDELFAISHPHRRDRRRPADAARPVEQLTTEQIGLAMGGARPTRQREPAHA